MTSKGQIFAWGGNSRGQLGLPVKETERQVEFTSYAPEVAQADEEGSDAGSMNSEEKMEKAEE